MGNSESQYSVQGSRSRSFTLPNRQKPYSLKLHSSKEDFLSHQSWWKTGSRISGFKSKTVSHGCLSQHKSDQSSMSKHYDYITKGREVKRRISTHAIPSSENGHPEENEGNCNDQAVNGYKTPERKPKPEELEDNSSPRVVIKSDGSVRVEFSQISKNSTLPDENGGPVQLLKFSPTSQSMPSPHHEPVLSPNTTTNKRSSLSSEGSWYDSPWGPGAELNDEDNTSTSLNRVSETLPSVRIEYFDEQLPPHYLYLDPGLATTFPTAKDLTLDANEIFKQRSSFLCMMEEPVLDESLGARQYSSFTLPCPKPKSITENSRKKEAIRSRMRRLNDWTGSLTRRKKSKEPRYKEPIDCFDSGIDGLTADTSSPSQVSSLLGYPKVQSRGRSQSQVLPFCSSSLGALHCGTDALRQNIYDNFMRELETSQTVVGSSEARGENSAEETESSSQETVGSLEQLDLLCEKEQGVVRRAGWLTFKPLLTLHKDRKLELVARRKWKQYWVTLKGCTLLFYGTYGKGSPEHETLPSSALLAEDGIVQAVPEHPKKENVFCLSNAYGDVYLFQATSQTDLENWVTAIHSASASLFAKQHGKEDTLLLLRGQIRSLLQKIDMDGKMKKMAELQLSVVSDPKNRKAIENQIQQWDQNLERFSMDLFRMRCYLSSLQGGELPNPKSLLATASRRSKAALSRLGIFSVSSFHAMICSRDEATLRKRSLSLSQGSRSKRGGVFSSLKGLDSLTKRNREKRPCASQECVSVSYCSQTAVCEVFDSAGGEQLGFVPVCSRETLDGLADVYSLAPPDGSQWDRGGMEKPVQVFMPDGQGVTVALSGQHTVAEVLNTACKVRNLDPSGHCLRLHKCVNDGMEVRTPAPQQLFRDLLYDELEVAAFSVYTLHMTKPTGTGDFGFAVTGLVDGLSHSRITITEVLSDGIAFNEGLRPGDEILVLNGCQVTSLDLALIQSLFSENTLHLTVRREPTALTYTPLTHICSSQRPARDSLYHYHRAKSASDVSCVSETSGKAEVETSRHHCQSLRSTPHSKSVETVCALYHSFLDTSGRLMEVQKETLGPDAALLRPCPRHMSVTDRLRKVIQELVDTEKSYVKDLSCLFEIYLKPLQKETFLTLDEMESLFGSLPEMLDFQNVFLQTLEERIALTPDFGTLETPVQFRKLLFSLGGSFLYYADHFKLYSGFCANHIKVQKVLERAKTDRAFKEFLDARNPTKQHSSTLESYLIKPVQRVLKYPLLLRELVSLTDTDSEEHYHLTEALKAMEKVASHINEMQKIYEDYGAVFDQLVAEQSGSEKEVTEISMGEFLMHSSVIWLNPLSCLGRMKKEPELTVFVFKKAVILVYRESNKLKKKMNVPRSAHSHGEQDQFKFRWLIPCSAMQVRLGNTAESNCIWELIHTKSELAGRPETLFQLCSSTPESKVNMVKVIRTILRENVRKGIRGTERPAERSCKEQLAPLRGSLPSSAKLGSSRASWLCQKPISVSSLTKSDTLKPVRLDSDSESESSRFPPSALSLQAPPTPFTPRRGSMRESDILSDDDGFSERLVRRDSSPGAIETQFQGLHLSTEARSEPEGREVNAETQPQLKRAHFSAVKRRSVKSEPRRSQASLLSLKQHSRSLDSQSEGVAVSVDLNALLEQDFSVHSLTSVINEDCFYEKATRNSTTATTS